METYREKNKKIQTWLIDFVKSGQVYSEPSVNIQYYYAINPSSNKSITIVHGFCEFFGKYHEVFYNFYHAGYSVFFVELRGHGLSYREVNDDNAVYVKDFDNYLTDVYAVTTKVVFPTTPSQEHILFSHSMGGCVSALYLAKYPDQYDKAIFSSPMFAINYQGVKPYQVELLKLLSNTFHLEKRIIPNTTRFTGIDEFENSSALCKERYLYQLNIRRANPHYRMWCATYGWTIAAQKAVKKIPSSAETIKIPVLLMQAEKDTMVENIGQDQFNALSKTTTFVIFKDAKHELFNGTDTIREKYWQTIFSFIN